MLRTQTRLRNLHGFVPRLQRIFRNLQLHVELQQIEIGFRDAADELQLLTIDEAAQRLRIGRSLAYELARTYLTTGGTDGLPVMKLGARMRVPRWALDELARTGRVVRLADVPPPAGLHRDRAS